MSTYESEKEVCRLLIAFNLRRLPSTVITITITIGTLNGKILDLSDKGNICLYHAELPTGNTYIALLNTSNGTLNFDGDGFSVTVSVLGSATQHLANETMSMR